MPMTPMPAETFNHSTHQISQNCGVLCRRFGQGGLEQLWLQHADRYRVGPLQLARGSGQADADDDDEGGACASGARPDHFFTAGRGP